MHTVLRNPTSSSHLQCMGAMQLHHHYLPSISSLWVHQFTLRGGVTPPPPPHFTWHVLDVSLSRLEVNGILSGQLATLQGGGGLQ